MAGTDAALIIQLSADVAQFRREMRNATGVFDAEGRKIERRQAKLKKQLSNWTLDFTGLKGISGAVAGLTGAAVIGGLGALVSKSLDAAAAIGDTAVQAGVSVERLQELRYAATQSGASFQVMDDGLTKLNQNLGEFVNTGAGRAAAAFKTLGIDKLINAGTVRNTEDVFDAVVMGLQKIPSEAQKASLAAKLFGQEAGPKLLQTIENGTDGLAKLSKQANDLGIVLSSTTVGAAKEAGDKLDALGSVIKSQVTGAVANLAPQIAELAQQITNSLPDLIRWAEKWADVFGLIHLSPMQKLQQQIADIDGQIEKLLSKNSDPGFVHRFLDGLGGGQADVTGHISDQVDALLKKRAEIQQAILQAQASGFVPTPAAPSSDKPKLKVNPTTTAASASRLADLAPVKVTPAIGTEDARKTLEQGQERLAQLQDEIASLGLAAAAADAYRWKQEALRDVEGAQGYVTEQQRAQIEATAAAMEKAGTALDAFRKHQDELSDAQQEAAYRQEQVVRGLEDVAVAGLHGFSSLKNAAGQFLEALAEMIIRVKVLDPLLKGLSTGGGLFGGGGDFFGSLLSAGLGLFGFADGGVMTPNGPRRLKRFAGGGVSNRAAIFGERGPEAAIPLPDGRSVPVTLRIPKIPMGGGRSVVQNFTLDMRGALVTEDLVKQINSNIARAKAEAINTSVATSLKATPNRMASFQSLGR